MNNDNLNNNINMGNIDVPVQSKTSFVDMAKDFFSRKRRAIVTSSSFLVAMVMTGSAFYLAYRTYNSKTNPEKIGAANPSCYIELQLNLPKETINPSVTPTSSSSSAVPVPSKTPVPSTKASATPTPTPVVTPTSTPTSTPVSLNCNACQFQSDLFWGPVITSFAGGLRYSTTPSRLIGAKSINTSPVPNCALTPVVPQSKPVIPVLSSGCSDPVGRGYLTGSIVTTNYKTPTGYLSGTIKNNTTNCTYTVGFASYKTNGSTIDNQNLYDYKTTTLGPGKSVTLNIKSPMVNDSNACHMVP